MGLRGNLRPFSFSPSLFPAVGAHDIEPQGNTNSGAQAMRLNEVSYSDAQPVDGYGAGFFRIGGKVHQGGVLTSAAGTMSWGGFEDTDPLLALVGDIDVLFIGTGGEVAHIPAALRQSLEDAGLGVESMNSPAACRTYNVLLSEGRRIALAALPV